MLDVVITKKSVICSWFPLHLHAIACILATPIPMSLVSMPPILKSGIIQVLLTLNIAHTLVFTSRQALGGYGRSSPMAFGHNHIEVSAVPKCLQLGLCKSKSGTVVSYQNESFSSK